MRILEFLAGVRDADAVDAVLVHLLGGSPNGQKLAKKVKIPLKSKCKRNFLFFYFFIRIQPLLKLNGGSGASPSNVYEVGDLLSS